MNNAPRPDAATACRLIREYFLSRTDIVAVRQSWRDRKSGEIITQPRPVLGDQHLDALLAYHVAGPDSGKAPPLYYFNRRTGGQVADGRGFDRVGTYAVAPDDSCVWLCLDFDGPGHPLPLADPLATMLACVERCRALGIPAHIEKSGSGQGWHIWIFFEGPVPAADARLLGHFIAPTGHVLATGEVADVRIGRGIECFPKQNSVSDKPFRSGNMLWLPHWYGAKDGGNQFNQGADGGLAPYAPEGFERLAVSRLQEILAQVPDDIRRFVLKTKGGLKEASAPKCSPPATPGNYAPTDADLIRAALDHVSPDIPYDDWLRIGMALHQWDPHAGLAIWESWSARGEKYVAGEPSIKWDGFTSGGGVTLGTLFDMAKKAGWEPPAHGRSALPTDEEIAAFMDIDPAALPVTSTASTPERAEILRCLAESSEPLGPKEIAELLQKDYWAVQKTLNRMSKSGQIEKFGHGKYRVLDTAPVQMSDLDTAAPVQTSDLDMSNSDLDTSQPVQTSHLDTSPPVQTGDLDTPNPPRLSNLDTSDDRPRLPTIVVNNRQGPPLIDEAWAAVRASNYPPRIFTRKGYLVRLAATDDAPQIVPMNLVALYGHLWRIAKWVTDSKDMQLAANPPKDVASDMLEYVDESLPQLEAVVSTPVFDRHGNLVQTPGYHRDARLYMHIAPGTTPVDVPAHPTDAQIAEAIALILNDLFVDFPFTTPAARAHAVAALLLPFVRRMIKGPTPVHLIESPSPGTGKTLLAKIISQIVLGKIVNATSLDLDEQALAKKITAILLGAPQIVLIDNVNTRTGLTSASLAAALTADPYSERVLYQSGMTVLPNQALWLLTANNPTTSLEIARRCVTVRIDSRRDRPWLMHGFKHEPLDDWVEENRSRLLAAVLTIVRGWVAAGMRPGNESLGSFESWARTIGGILQFAGIPGFLSNLDDLYEAADSEGNEWRGFVAAWWERFGNRWVSAGELFDLAINGDMLANVTGDKSPRSQKTRLGKALTNLRDRQFDTYRVKVRRDRHSKQTEYGLEMVGPDSSAAGSVLSLFPEQRPACPANVPQEKPHENQGSAGHAGHAGLFSTIAHAGGKDTCAGTHAYGDMAENVPQDPHDPPNVENIEKIPAGHGPRQKPNVPHVPQTVDLADFDPEEEEHV